jgi:hypothetical protein
MNRHFRSHFNERRLPHPRGEHLDDLVDALRKPRFHSSHPVLDKAQTDDGEPRDCG